MRTEQEIFDELERLSAQEGFWEVVAFFCWKDTFIHFSGEKLDAEIFAQSFDRTRLSRTELSTLIGLACKSGFNDKQLDSAELKEKAEHVWQLLEELHRSFLPPLDITSLSEKINTKDSDVIPDFGKFMGELIPSSDKNHYMREAIFYGGDGVFKHQYRDLAKRRYSLDEAWVQANKGFKISQAVDVISAIEEIQLEKINQAQSSTEYWSLPCYLAMFIFSTAEVVRRSALGKEIVATVIAGLSTKPEEGMSCFKSVDDFNHKNAFPIIIIDEDIFVTFQAYNLWESLYESPFFWFNEDKNYKSIASKHRGAFTEDFSAERLASVFGRENVLTNIDIFDGKGKAGEIDVLVTFGFFAIVVQAKSKKLTIEARKGNSKQLEDDFKKAIQDAYDQAYLCSQLLQKEGYIFKDEFGNEIKIQCDFKTIFPICVVSDHFPGLAAQARHFLKYQTTKVIKHPYVMDVFLIDMITEMLSSPLRVLDYFIKRSDYGNSLLSNHELVILSTYIKKNLYFEEEPTLIMLDDDISTDLELAMLARRDSHDGGKTPEGFLTFYKNSHVGGIIDDIEFSEDYCLQKLGLHLLSMNSDSINLLNKAISKMIAQFKIDHRHHDITLPLIKEKTGLSFHCNEDDNETSYKRLVTHCEKRKYKCKADSWVGCCFSPTKNIFRFASYHESKWHQSDEMDRLVDDLKPISSVHKIENIRELSFGEKRQKKSEKTGRNEPCPCGSGKKYKRCCAS
ncbi:SEC-C metal-binding domain-containing protein [Yersinia enterocolitica]|uniref:SEC-C metal-binding domain-containing protein n=1 Tax=Yersinia enterocolitica TaxID=630 RepID=UPI001C60A28F|nr:SEC-C metal-binding domain-containing protein [Yersinia enterocolitica]MBW5848307.1 SEC-C domain-containing protein [Yersinia enterocolitica]MBW5856062.1 SEC-C domain-containing protein [Yersinia enterocolitica]MBW5860451.1 SEC-C domain-containing protein [Yersinia enterocolitica]MBW5865756.1 SEC-C domain-containing protein [Yersinia enterocolitica]